MIKHVGKHNGRRVIVIFREVPDEEHMSLVVYSDMLPQLVHDELMKCVEGEAAQSTPDLSNVVFRTLMADGTSILQTLHQREYLKKVPCNQVILTPTAKSTVRLDELNNILKEMAKGEDAVKRLAELDSNRGMAGKVSENIRELGNPEAPSQISENGVLSDVDIARNLQSQAETMKRQAETLLAEAKRLEQEANELSPTDAKKTTTKKTATKKKQAA
jgi:hypothetical protein